MDPLSITASLLAVATAGIESTRSLRAAVKRYQTRDATLQRLLAEVDDMENSLRVLEQLLESSKQEPGIAGDVLIAELLQSPIKRCNQLCKEFEIAMHRFSGKSKTNIVDWAKMEFMRGDFSQFLDTLAGYKATIAVGLGVLTMRTVKLSGNALTELEEMVKNTAYSLGLQLQRINAKMDNWVPGNDRDDSSSVSSLNLLDERQVTEKCLQICEDARLHLEVASRRSNIIKEQPLSGSSEALQEAFETQLLTRKALSENHASLVKLVGELRSRLEKVIWEGDSPERSRLEADILTSKKCLELCNLASSEVNNQKIHIIGEVFSDGDSDQVIVTTLADVFNVGKATSTNRSALLVGSMSDEALMKISGDRYSSRFGAANVDDSSARSNSASRWLDIPIARSGSAQGSQVSKASPNETRKRETGKK